VTVDVTHALPAAAEDGNALESPDANSSIDAATAEMRALKAKQTEEILNLIKQPASATKKSEVLVKQLQAEARKDSLAMAQVIRSWITADD